MTWRVVLAGALLLLGLLLGWQVVSGVVFLYVHERSIPLIALTVPVLVAMAAAVARGAARPPMDRLGLGLLALAIGVGILAPPSPLDGAALALQQPTTLPSSPRLMDAPLRWPAGTLELDLRQLGELSRNDPYLRGLDGQRATLLGFVHRPAGMPSDQLVVGRFLVRCCTADAIPLTMRVRSSAASDLAPDTWVEVTGVIGRTDEGDRALPLVEAAQIVVVPQPSRPYLYP